MSRPHHTVTVAVLLPGLLATLPLSEQLSAQQNADDWALRVPVQTDTGAMAPHPVTGRPVRFGGWNQQFGLADGTWEWHGDVWLRHVSASGPELRFGHAMATDAQRGELVLFGGGSWLPNDTWTWDGSHWQAHATPPLLTRRTGHAMAYDSVRGRVVLFGGTAAGLQNDTWEWDGTAWHLMQPGAPPPARTGHAMAFDAARGRVVLFGGTVGSFGGLNDTWEWDGTYWTQRFAPNPPAGRAQPGLAYDPLRQRTVLFGGTPWHPVLGTYADTWEWDGTTWTQMQPLTSPPPRIASAMLWDRSRGRIVMFGTQIGADDAWEYDGTTWQQTAGMTAPPPRSQAAMTFDPQQGNTVLFGGFATGVGSNLRGDTWTWDGERWLERTPVQSPGARQGHVLAFDAARGVATLFGGGIALSPYTLSDETWTWNGATWSQAQPTNRPPARASAGLAYHAATQRLVLFGGSTPSATLGDTWTFDGIDWTQESPASSPSPRFTPGLASEGQHVLLFGGALSIPSSNPQPYADTWRWDGVNWTQLQPVTSPPAQYSHGLLEDPDRGRNLLIGGRVGTSSGILPLDCWSWDGATWSQLTTATTPVERGGAAIAYDRARRQTLMFGGVRSGYQNDTWALAAAFDQTTFGSGCAGTLGVPAITSSPQSLPELGGIVIADVTNLPAALCAVTMGFSDTTTGSQALPLPLGPFGMPGCDLLVAPDATTLLLGSSGTATWSLPVPFSAGFLGLTFFYQALVFDPPANAAGLTASNGGRCRIGH